MIEYTVKVYPNGNKSWFLNGKYHREDGPAREYASSSKYWYLNDKLHREDGPAYESANGNKFWYLNGKLHREDGPAIEYADGNKFWFLSGERVTEEEHKRLTSKVVEMTMEDRALVVGGVILGNDKCHREDGPAIEGANGSKYWYLNGKLHREDGPAIEYG